MARFDLIEKEPIYPEQDHAELGEFYIRHVSAMTSLGLHAKSDIAAQLAWRDQRITALAAEVEGLRADKRLSEQAACEKERRHAARADKAEAKLSACEALAKGWRAKSDAKYPRGADARNMNPETRYEIEGRCEQLDACADELDAAMQEKPHD